MTELDPHGQPFNLRFNEGRRTERDLSEMLGLAKGVLADGVVTEVEAELLRNWTDHHPDAVARWPINHLHARLEHIFSDGRVDDAERQDLSALLGAIAGGKADGLVGPDQATDLPIDRPPPVFAWEGSLFVFTGRFAYGPRRACEQEVMRRGALCGDNITKDTNYLVIGTFGSRDWIQTSWGRKIEKAVKYRAAGCLRPSPPRTTGYRPLADGRSCGISRIDTGPRTRLHRGRNSRKSRRPIRDRTRQDPGAGGVSP